MIWVVGSAGMLGKELCKLLEKKKINYSGTDREVSILDPVALNKHAEKENPDWIVNCSAYTAVDKAEDDIDAAYQINRDGVGNLALLSAERTIPIIHISTDYVFDGTSRTPLSEDASIGPIGVYGKSKLAGENLLRDYNPKHFIIRTAWLYGQYGPNFVFTMVKLMNSHDSIKVVDDQIGTPTSAKELADLIVKIILSESIAFGTYHFSGGGQCSWFKFAEEIYRVGREGGLIRTECQINPCSSDEFPTKAKRPAFSLLAKDKVKSEFNIDILKWQDSLSAFMTQESIKKTD